MSLLRLILFTVLFFTFSFFCHAQYFSLPGSFSYSLNSRNLVFDISPDGKIGAALRNDPATIFPALLTTFNPITGEQYDQQSFGSGPLSVKLAQTTDGLRAVVLTSQGGARAITLFDVSPTGLLTKIKTTQLTSSNVDSGSNIVLSGESRVGFALVASDPPGSGKDLVDFSLVDGSIVSKFHVSPPLSFSADELALYEKNGKRLLAYLRDLNTLEVDDASDLTSIKKVGTITLPRNTSFSAIFTPGIAFSADGRYVFIGNGFINFSAVDLSSLQVVSSIGGDYEFGRVKIFESNGGRLLAVYSGTGVLLIDALDPANLKIVNQYKSDTLSYKGDFDFSRDGTRLFILSTKSLLALDVASLNKVWEQPLKSSNPPREEQLKVYFNGTSEEVLGAWDLLNGTANSSLFGAFPAIPPSISINDVTVQEGDSGTSPANFSVTLSSQTLHRVSVQYATADVTASNGSDYGMVSGTLTFEAGETTKSVSVPIYGDTIDEFDETFTLNLSNATVGLINRGQGICTIIDDDPPPSMSINDVSVTEGNSGTTSVKFTVTLSLRSEKPITINYATADGTAIAGSDYVVSSGTLNFNPGETSKNISLSVIGDTIAEPDETFSVNLINPVNVTLAKGRGVCTILDDDTPSIILEEGTNRAVALDSVTLRRDPFPLSTSNNFSTDKRTRIMLFAWHVNLLPGEPSSLVTVQGTDVQGSSYDLPVEFVGAVPNLSGVTEIVVKLSESLTTSGDLQLTVKVRNVASNKVPISIQ